MDKDFYKDLTAALRNSGAAGQAAPKGDSNKSAPKTSTAKATAKAAPKTDTPKTKGGAKYVIPKDFKQAIEDYLTGRPDMSEKLKQTGKSIDKCCEYIYDRMLKRAQKERGGATTVGMYVAPEEIFGMAVHYYDETDEDLKKEA